MIEIITGHSTTDGGCMACQQFHTSAGTAPHHVMILVVSSQSGAQTSRYCADCWTDLFINMAGVPTIARGVQERRQYERLH